MAVQNKLGPFTILFNFSKSMFYNNQNDCVSAQLCCYAYAKHCFSSVCLKQHSTSLKNQTHAMNAVV